ncbi:hypothetical protein N5D61_15290 [Pseudomonas sp. GD03842]|uniref:hypothetical protein n=1 Tax=Pseudomonas sp. GD03842 TaxID=2975385 RepID=UPI00244D75A3|nr:hypothetical protein [Pseudomonas sp. GD03842]MDH0747703.1 hypothetical protein [Pseudomonas sp. GD03842]
MSQSVTLIGIQTQETGNTETPERFISMPQPGIAACEPRFSGICKNWHGSCYVLRTTKITNGSNPIKTRRIGSDITRTTRTETQLTDFFGVDRFVRLRPLNRTENNKTALRQLPRRVNRKIEAVSALKKIRLLLAPNGVAQKSKKGLAANNNNRSPKNKKEHAMQQLGGELRLPFVLSGV